MLRKKPPTFAEVDDYCNKVEAIIAGAVERQAEFEEERAATAEKLMKVAAHFLPGGGGAVFAALMRNHRNRAAACRKHELPKPMPTVHGTHAMDELAIQLTELMVRIEKAPQEVKEKQKVETQLAELLAAIKKKEALQTLKFGKGGAAGLTFEESEAAEASYLEEIYNGPHGKETKEIVDAVMALSKSEPWVPTPFQTAILNALEGKALKTDALGNATGDRRRLFKPGGIKELKTLAKVRHHRRLGYYRPDAPPPALCGSTSASKGTSVGTK